MSKIHIGNSKKASIAAAIVGSLGTSLRDCPICEFELKCPNEYDLATPLTIESKKGNIELNEDRKKFLERKMKRKL